MKESFGNFLFNQGTFSGTKFDFVTVILGLSLYFWAEIEVNKGDKNISKRKYIDFISKDDD